MRVAIAQAPGTRLDQWRQTLDLIDDLIDQAAKLHADLVVLPECVWPAYVLGSREAYRTARRDGLPEPGTFLDHVRQLARARRLAVCAGFVEEQGEHLFNTAGLIDSAGELRGVYRKCFLWDFDHDYFVPGERIEPIQTPLGSIGVLICADARLPETSATLARRGATLLLQPTGWVNVGTPTALWNPQPAFLMSARAAETGLPVVSASKWGVEGNTTFVGSSLICDSDGRVLVQCPSTGTHVMAADVTPRSPRPAQLSDAERAALLAEAPAQPPAANVPPVELILLPAETTAPAAEATVDDASTILRIFVQPPGTDAQGSLPPEPAGTSLLVHGPTSDVLELGSVRLAAVADVDAGRFAALRRFTLLGVHAAIVLGDGATLTLARARACENRIFVIWARSAGVLVIDPRGNVVVEAGWPSGSQRRRIAARLDLRSATDKQFAPNTDLLTGRSPRLYAF